MLIDLIQSQDRNVLAIAVRVRGSVCIAALLLVNAGQADDRPVMQLPDGRHWRIELPREQLKQRAPTLGYDVQMFYREVSA